MGLFSDFTNLFTGKKSPAAANGSAPNSVQPSPTNQMAVGGKHRKKTRSKNMRNKNTRRNKHKN